MTLFLLLGGIILILYYIGTKNHNYWRKRGVEFDNPHIFFGSNIKKFIENISEAERIVNLYRRYPKEKFVGLFQGNNPALLIRDPDIIKHILVTDFKYFQYRGLNTNKTVTETLMRNILFEEGDTWRLMRQKLTPVFTSGKLKSMFPLIVKVTKTLEQTAEDLAHHHEVDIHELMARYTTDIIGACAFGFNSDALKEESSEFRKLGKRIFCKTKRDIIVALLKLSAPKLFQSLNHFDIEIENQVVFLVKKILLQRNYSPSERHDFIDLMLEQRLQRKIIGKIDTSDGNANSDVELDCDDLLLAGQVFIFFAAGFETSSYASSVFLHILAYHPEEQARCQQDIDEVLARHNGELSYEAVKEMKYLEMALKESMRLLPSPSIITRKCAKKYTFPNTNVTIDEGVAILICTEALCLDEQYFKDPEMFRPQRFHPDYKDNLTKNTYLPFGDGPRACIGGRMGIMQSMAGVATILRKFTVAPSRSTIWKPQIDPKSNIIKHFTNGLPLSLKLRNTIVK